MAPKKKVTGLIKLQIQAGAANPAPPIGPALGQHGVNIMAVSYTHLTLPTTSRRCRSRWSPYH